jgi:hypothetical protein
MNTHTNNRTFSLGARMRIICAAVTDGLSRATIGGRGKPDKADTRKIERPGGRDGSSQNLVCDLEA